MKRILYLTTDSKLGGTERVIYNLARALHGVDFEVHVDSLKGPGELQDLLNQAGVPSTNLNMASKLDLGVIGRLRRLIREFQPDLLCTYLFHANHLGRLVGRMSGVRKILTVQESVDAWRRWHHNLIDRLTVPLVDQFAANSEAVRQRFHEFSGIPMERVEVIYNGIDLAPYRHLENSKCTTLRESLGLDAGSIVFITVAHINPYKGHRHLVEAAARIVKKYPEARWLFVGSGRSDEEVRRQIGDVGLQDRIHMLGVRKDIPDLLNASDVFVLPSLWEGCPLSILEAMAAGLPVIASSVGGIPELVQQEKTGLLVRPGEAADLADKMQSLLEDGDRRRNMGQEGKARAFAEFSLEMQVARTRELYDRILSD